MAIHDAIKELLDFSTEKPPVTSTVRDDAGCVDLDINIAPGKR
jgi:hypothetical protein